MEYMDAGGSFLIAYTDLGLGNGSTTFYQTYLQSNFIGDDPYIDTLNGQDIMAGLTLNIASDLWPDHFSVAAQGTQIFQFSGGNAAGVAVDREGYKAIYFSFDYDCMASAANEEAVIDRSLDFLQ